LQGSLVLGDDAGTDSTGQPHSGSVALGSGDDGAAPFSGGHSGSSSSGDDVKGPDDASDPAGDDGGVSGESGSGCDFSGTWATKLTINVNWVPQGVQSVIIAPGTGIIQQWVKSIRTVKAGATIDTATVCGITLPDFSGTNFVGGETYGVRFPDSLFDSSFLPSFAIQGTLSDATPRAFFNTKAAAVLLGMTLANAATVAWPTPVNTSVDSDKDGLGGVTVTAATGPTPDGTGNYSNFPVDIASDRANRLGIVIRQVTQLAGQASDCDHISGTVTIPQLPNTPTGKYAIDSHVIDCKLVDGSACAPSQAAFLDGTQPVFSPAMTAGAATFISVRMTSGTCAAVRQTLP
jgi:hypothetical protein